MTDEPWLEMCTQCGTHGCEACDFEGYVQHECEDSDDTWAEHLQDEDMAVASLIAEDDQIRADLEHDAQAAGYHRTKLIEQGFSEDIAERIVLARCEHDYYPFAS